MTHRRWLTLTAVALLAAALWLHARSRGRPDAAAPPRPADTARATTWTGAIRAADGGAVGGAVVTALLIRGADAPIAIAVATSDGLGAYALAPATAVDDGLLLLQVRHRDHAAAGRRVDPAAARHDFVLEPLGVALAVHVVDADGAPVAGGHVEVAIEPAHGDADALVWIDADAGADGVARLPPITRGAASIHWTATAAGRGRGLGLHAKPAGGAPIAITAALVPGVAVAGRTVDDTGAPMPGVPLTLIEHDGPWRADVQTGDDGGFALADVPAGIGARIVVGGDFVARGGYDDAAVAMPAAAGAAPITIAVEPASAIAGRVVGAAGRPVSDAAIEATPADQRHASRRAVRTDADGRFRVRGLRAGTLWTVEARHAAHAPAFVERVAAGDDALAIALVAGGGLTGRVVDDGGAPVPGVELYVHRVERDGDATVALREHAAARTDDDGAWSFAHLSPGRFRVEVRPPARMQYAPLAADARDEEVVAGETRQLAAFTLVRPGGVRAAVEASGATLAGATGQVLLLPAGQGGAPHRLDVQLGDDGGLVLDGIEPGTYRAALYLPALGYAAIDALVVEAGRDGAAAFAYRDRVELTGTLRDAAGAPVADAPIDAFRLDGGSQPLHGLPGRAPDNYTGNAARSDDHGRFRLPGLAPGRYRLRAVDPRGLDAPAVRDLDVEGAANAALTLGAGAALEIHVVDADGHAAPGKAVVVEADAGRAFSAAIRTDADGVARVRGLPAHAYEITAAVDGQPRIALALTAGARRTVELRAHTSGGTP